MKYSHGWWSYTNISIQHVFSLVELLQGRSAHVRDGDTTAHDPCDQEHQAAFALVQSVVKQVGLIDRDLGNVHLTPAHTGKQGHKVS